MDEEEEDEEDVVDKVEAVEHVEQEEDVVDNVEQVEHVEEDDEDVVDEVETVEQVVEQVVVDVVVHPLASGHNPKFHTKLSQSTDPPVFSCSCTLQFIYISFAASSVMSLDVIATHPAPAS